MAVGSCLVALAVGACGGPSSRDYREDRQALTKVLAADAHTAERIDPLLDRIGGTDAGAATVALLEGDVRGTAERALKLARQAKVRTPEGRALREELLDALEDRRAEGRALEVAARSGRPEDVLAAIRAARELEERLEALDGRVEALSRQR